GTRAGAESVKRTGPGADNACGPGARYGCPTTTVKELRPMIFGRVRSLGRHAQAQLRGWIASRSRPSGVRGVALVVLAGCLLAGPARLAAEPSSASHGASSAIAAAFDPHDSSPPPAQAGRSHPGGR